ncbi:MAG: hypothetical protein U0X73_02375 [Thermoanaerobaculia bacterium]
MSRPAAPAFDFATPQPSNLWIGWTPRQWPRAPRPWLDPARRRLVWPGEEVEPRLPEAPEVDPGGGRVHLPPAPPRLAGDKARLRAALAPAASVWCQEEAGSAPSDGSPGELLLDWTARLLGVGDGAAALPAGATVLVPLLPGMDGADSGFTELLAAIAGARPAAVVGRVPELAPGDRRRLAALGDESRFGAIHHGAAPSERDFARAVAAAGLSPFPPAPVFGRSRRERNRAAAAHLAEAAELWLGLGRSEAVGQELLAAARRLDSLPQDVEALAREGHLAVLAWLPLQGARCLVEWARGEGGGGLAALRSAYLESDGR